jgi:ParB-like chromosome segregation protein Spo0J
MSELQFHPLANIFPLMEGEEFDAFVADIARHGQHARIVLKDGMILEGRNRYRACRKLGIEPSFACKEYSDQITDLAAYVISANIRRRHLSAEDRDHARRGRAPRRERAAAGCRCRQHEGADRGSR